MKGYSRLPAFSDNICNSRIHIIRYLKATMLKSNSTNNLHWIHSSPWLLQSTKFPQYNSIAKHITSEKYYTISVEILHSREKEKRKTPTFHLMARFLALREPSILPEKSDICPSIRQPIYAIKIITRVCVTEMNKFSNTEG